MWKTEWLTDVPWHICDSASVSGLTILSAHLGSKLSFVSILLWCIVLLHLHTGMLLTQVKPHNDSELAFLTIFPQSHRTSLLVCCRKVNQQKPQWSKGNSFYSHIKPLCTITINMRVLFLFQLRFKTGLCFRS